MINIIWNRSNLQQYILYLCIMVQVKKLLAFVLIKFILLGMFWQFSVITYFYLNQEAITDQYCVNKNEPEKNCHGKCHLEKVLNLTTENVNEEPQTFKTNVLLIFQSFEELNENPFFISASFEKINFPYLFSVKTFQLDKIYTPPKVA